MYTFSSPAPSTTSSASSFGSTSSRPGESAQAPVKAVLATSLPPSPPDSVEGHLFRPLCEDETVVLSTPFASEGQADQGRVFSSDGFSLDAASASLLALEAYEGEDGFPWFAGAASVVQREGDPGTTAEDGRAREVEPEVRDSEARTSPTGSSSSMDYFTSSSTSPSSRAAFDMPRSSCLLQLARLDSPPPSSKSRIRTLSLKKLRRSPTSPTQCSSTHRTPRSSSSTLKSSSIATPSSGVLHASTQRLVGKLAGVKRGLRRARSLSDPTHASQAKKKDEAARVTVSSSAPPPLPERGDLVPSGAGGRPSQKPRDPGRGEREARFAAVQM
ncbi:hypothetical protein JCM5296_003247 [Sporobolomyces johnsonii]